MRVTIQDDELIPESMYHGVLTAVSPGPDGQYGPSVKLEFTLQDPNFPGKTVNGLCGTSRVSPNSKLYRWIRVLTGTDFDAGAEIDLQSLIGKQAGVIIKHTTSSKGGTSNTYNNVSDLVTLNAAWMAPAPQTPQPGPPLSTGGTSRNPKPVAPSTTPASRVVTGNPASSVSLGPPPVPKTTLDF